MGGVSNAVGQSSNQPNQQPQYGQQGLAGMVQGASNAIGGMMQSPFMGQVGQVISGQQPTQSGLTNSSYNSGTPSYGQMPQGIAYQQLANGMPAYQQPVGNTPVSQQSFSANMGRVAPGTDTDAMYQNYLNAYNQNPNINPYTLQPAQLSGQSMTPEQSAFLDMQKQQMGIFPQMSQQSVQAPHMTAYDRLVQQRNQNLAGPTSNPFGFPQRNDFQQQIAPKAPTLNAQQMTNGPQRGFPQQSMLANALRNRRG